MQACYTNALQGALNSTTSKWMMDYREAIHSDYRSHSSPMAVCTKQGNFCANSLYCYKNIIFKSSITMSAVPLASTVVLHNYFIE